jgi:hypothetical protein
MRDDLMAVEIEVDPMVRAPALGAAEKLAVEATRGGEIVDRKGEVEGRQAHGQRPYMLSRLSLTAVNR